MDGRDAYRLRCQTTRPTRSPRSTTTRSSASSPAASIPTTHPQPTRRWPGCSGRPPRRPARTSSPASRRPWQRSARPVPTAPRPGAGRAGSGAGWSRWRWPGSWSRAARPRLARPPVGCGQPSAPPSRLGYAPPPGDPAPEGRVRACPDPVGPGRVGPACCGRPGRPRPRLARPGHGARSGGRPPWRRGHLSRRWGGPGDQAGSFGQGQGVQAQGAEGGAGQGREPPRRQAELAVEQPDANDRARSPDSLIIGLGGAHGGMGAVQQ
jgi:hypothetical protein